MSYIFSTALAIYVRSLFAYEAIKQFNILKLPANLTLQSYTGTLIHIPGASASCTAKLVSRYLVTKSVDSLESKSLKLMELSYLTKRKLHANWYGTLVAISW